MFCKCFTVVTCKIKHWNIFANVLQILYFTCNHGIMNNGTLFPFSYKYSSFHCLEKWLLEVDPRAKIATSVPHRYGYVTYILSAVRNVVFDVYRRAPLVAGKRRRQDLRRHLPARLVTGHFAADIAARRTLRLALGERLLDAVRTERVATRQLLGQSRRTHADGTIVCVANYLLIYSGSCFRSWTFTSVRSVNIGKLRLNFTTQKHSILKAFFQRIT